MHPLYNTNTQYHQNTRVRMNQAALLSLLLTVIWSGCANYYLPNSHQVPLLTKKGDARLALTATDHSSEIVSPYGVEFQGSYAATDKIGVVLNSTVAISFGGEVYKYLDLGGGYFKANSLENFIFETYGGVGFGNSSRAFIDGSFYNNTNFVKYYVQPSLGYRAKNFELALSWRLASLNFTEMSNSGVLDVANQNIVQSIQNKPSSILSEPAVTVRLGLKAVKLQAQWGWSHSLSGGYYPQGQSYLNVGFFISMGRE